MVNVSRLSEIENAIDFAINRPDPLMKEIRKIINRLHPYSDGRSSQRVLEATNSLIDRGQGHLRKKPLNLMRRLKIRRQLGYYHF
jgi:hypothetical protein